MEPIGISRGGFPPNNQHEVETEEDMARCIRQNILWREGTLDLKDICRGWFTRDHPLSLAEALRHVDPCQVRKINIFYYSPYNRPKFPWEYVIALTDFLRKAKRLTVACISRVDDADHRGFGVLLECLLGIATLTKLVFDFREASDTASWRDISQTLQLHAPLRHISFLAGERLNFWGHWKALREKESIEHVSWDANEPARSRFYAKSFLQTLPNIKSLHCSVDLFMNDHARGEEPSLDFSFIDWLRKLNHMTLDLNGDESFVRRLIEEPEFAAAVSEIENLSLISKYHINDIYARNLLGFPGLKSLTWYSQRRNATSPAQFSILLSHGALEKLELGDSMGHNKLARLLSEFVASRNQVITQLSLPVAFIRKGHIKKLRDTISCGNLKKLEICLHPDDAHLVSSLFGGKSCKDNSNRCNATLEHLVVNLGNQKSPIGTYHYRVSLPLLAVEKNTKIQKLTIHTHHEGDVEGWDDMCECVARMKHLRKFKLGLFVRHKNSINMDRLGDALEKNTSLVEIDIYVGGTHGPFKAQWVYLCKLYQQRNRCLHSPQGPLPLPLLPAAFRAMQPDIGSIYLVMRHFASSFANNEISRPKRSQACLRDTG